MQTITLWQLSTWMRGSDLNASDLAIETWQIVSHPLYLSCSHGQTYTDKRQCQIPSPISPFIGEASAFGHVFQREF